MLRKGLGPQDPGKKDASAPKAGPPAFRPSEPEKEEKKGGFPLWFSRKKGEAASVPAAGAETPGALSAPLRVRGVAGATNIVERLKSLKRRDLVFILSGLAVLLMAPLAEYLLTGPEEGGSLQEGFDRKGGVFPGVGGPYEEGVAGIAPGGLLGQQTDVITPLNVRDPSALVMGPGGTQQQPQAQTPPTLPQKPPTDWKDVIRDGAKRGGGEAVKRAPGLPRPTEKLKTALKDWSGVLSAARGGGGPSVQLQPPTSQGLLSRPRVGSSFARSQPLPGLRGGSRSPFAGGGGPGLSAGQGGRFGGGGASTEGAPPGFSAGGSAGGARGGPGEGGETRSPGGNSAKDSKSASRGEDLGLLAAKLNLERAIALKWDKRRYDELERKKMLEQMAAQTASQALLKILEKLLEKPKDGGGDKGGGGGKPPGGGTPPRTDIPKGATGTPPGGDPTGATAPPGGGGPGGPTAPRGMGILAGAQALRTLANAMESYFNGLNTGSSP